MHRTGLAPRVLTLLLTVALAACGGPSGPGTAPPDPSRLEPGAGGDPHSWARPEEVAVRHLSLELDVDFAARRLEGSATLELERFTDASELVLDTRGLDVREVFAVDAAGTRSPARYRFGEELPIGRPLAVELEPETTAVRVAYRTSPEAGALLWLEPEGTSGGEHPFLFTQSQAVLARTWVPCQDTPRVRMTYDATVRVPPPLMALMSAENPTEKSAEGVYRFQMEQPIPSYLLALAVGDLRFEEIGPRTGVYAEPEVVEKAAWEFAETEKMMELAEGLYGPYLWGRYDILVLPPSFPFGGMENPRLTFATPTVLAGDRSLTALVAHELAHSWSGNLVTNATWNDLWLNEGFTVYFELRIMEALHGRDYAEMLALLGRQSLAHEIEDLGADSSKTRLHLTTGAETDPDENFSDVPYEKGYFFLRLLEESVGRERFDAFLADYFERFAFRSMDTAGFLDHLRSTLLAEKPGLEEEIGVAEWIDGTGMPANWPEVESPAFSKVDAEIAAWEAGKPAASLATEGWNPHQWLHFVRHLPEGMGAERMAELDAAFGFTRTGNSEVLHAWLLHAIGNGYEPASGRLESFLTGMGRRKFLAPLYTKLAETKEGRQRGLAIYEQARPGYHPMAVATVDEILGWRGGSTG